MLDEATQARASVKLGLKQIDVAGLKRLEAWIDSGSSLNMNGSVLSFDDP